MTPPTVQFIPAGGLSLIIHDAFSGSGSPSGRTPDTVDNGNAWEVGPHSYNIASGYLYATSGGGTGGVFIDAASSSVTIEATTQGDGSGGVNEYRHGIIWNYNTSTGAFERLVVLNRTELYHQAYTGAVFSTNVQVDSFSTRPNNTDIYWTMDITSGSVSWDLVQSGSSFTSGSLTPTAGPDKVGYWQRYAITGTHCADFKVYA